MIQQHYFGLVYTKGDMSAHEVYAEMKPERVIPILVIRCEGATFVPCFTSPQIAQQFARRNLPDYKKSGIGTFNVLPQDAQFMIEKGWEPLIFDFPRKVKNLADEFDVELLETDVERAFCADPHAYEVLNS